MIFGNRNSRRPVFYVGGPSTRDRVLESICPGQLGDHIAHSTAGLCDNAQPPTAPQPNRPVRYYDARQTKHSASVPPSGSVRRSRTHQAPTNRMPQQQPKSKQTRPFSLQKNFKRLYTLPVPTQSHMQAPSNYKSSSSVVPAKASGPAARPAARSAVQPAPSVRTAPQTASLAGKRPAWISNEPPTEAQLKYQDTGPGYTSDESRNSSPRPRRTHSKSRGGQQNPRNHQDPQQYHQHQNQPHHQHKKQQPRHQQQHHQPLHQQQYQPHQIQPSHQQPSSQQHQLPQQNHQYQQQQPHHYQQQPHQQKAKPQQYHQDRQLHHTTNHDPQANTRHGTQQAVSPSRTQSRESARSGSGSSAAPNSRSRSRSRSSHQHTGNEGEGGNAAQGYVAEAQTRAQGGAGGNGQFGRTGPGNLMDYVRHTAQSVAQKASAWAAPAAEQDPHSQHTTQEGQRPYKIQIVTPSNQAIPPAPQTGDPPPPPPPPPPPVPDGVPPPPPAGACFMPQNLPQQKKKKKDKPA